MLKIARLAGLIFALLTVECGTESATVTSLQVYPLHSIWKEMHK